MVDSVLIDNLHLKSRDFAVRWKNLIRKAPQLKHYNELSDETLIASNESFYPLVGRTLDRGLDRSLLGDFYVRMGKQRMKEGFPVSEIIYAVNLVQKVIIEYVVNEFAPDNSVKMYQAVGVTSKIAESFLLGCFYLTKGFLEETYIHMNSRDDVSKELLRKYFPDDFFFKKD